jgi:hypothetical protein
MPTLPLIAGGCQAATRRPPSTDLLRAPPIDDDVGGAGRRVSTAIQLTSHVWPSSAENACSKRYESGWMSLITFRT